VARIVTIAASIVLLSMTVPCLSRPIKVTVIGSRHPPFTENKLMINTRILAKICGLAMTAMASTATAEDTVNYHEYPTEALARIEASEKAFVDKDLDTLAGDLAEDFTWYKIDAEGPKQMVSGREATLELLNVFFTNDGGWQDADVHRLGHLGNLFVQVEVDRFITPDGPKTIRSLNIYEMKGGKRWREWKFYPNE
jgi:limonene-1,2-epoxide hydrolase